MELAFRKGRDAFVPAGAYRDLEQRIFARRSIVEQIPALVLSCFDRGTRLMPFVLYDKLMFPAGARVIAGALNQAGFKQTRAVFQLWNPNFQVSQARIDGRPPQILLLSSMQLHSLKAQEAIRDAWSMGDERPLILVGGAKTFHEPYHFWPIETPVGPGGADAVITGEAYILLDMLEKVLAFHHPGEHIRASYERARHAGALNEVPGLVYLDPQSSWQEPRLVDTGLQQLVQHLDELPQETSGLSVLEPPSRGKGLSPRPLADNKVRRHCMIMSLIITQGCKFSCSYCPIPALNQKTWRFRSPEGLAQQFRSVRERFGIKFYFGADDNFLNRRETAVEFFETLARSTLSNGKRLGRQVQWGTEATQFDTHKNIDLLPLARQAGLSAIWFGIEDLTAELINKGQKPEKTVEVFREMHRNKICPMAMMMYYDGQPYHTTDSLHGITNQIDFLRKAGAVSVQVTLHTPAIGTKEYEQTYDTGKVLAGVGNYPIVNRHIDGNHAIVQGKTPMWQKQLEAIGAYFRFYNPVNLIRSLRDNGSPLRKYQAGYQLIGMLGTLWSLIFLLPYIVRLMISKPRFHKKAPPASHVPVRLAPGAFPRHQDGLPRVEPAASDRERRAA